MESGTFATHTPMEACQALTAVLAKLASRQYDSRFLFEVRLALEEILANAFRHGNNRDPTRTVLMYWAISDETVAFEIQDEGPGFDLGSLPDPTLPGTLDRPHGRGVWLAKNFMEEFTVGRNVVSMSRSRQWPSRATRADFE